MEIVRIAHPRHRPEQTPLPEEARTDIGRPGDAPQVGAVEADGDEDRGGEEEGGNHGPGVGVVRPIRGIEGILPGDGASLVIAVPVRIG